MRLFFLITFLFSLVFISSPSTGFKLGLAEQKAFPPAGWYDVVPPQTNTGRSCSTLCPTVASGFQCVAGCVGGLTDVLKAVSYTIGKDTDYSTDCNFIIPTPATTITADDISAAQCCCQKETTIPSPTTGLTNTPVPSLTPTGPNPTKLPACPKKPQGDANCDGVIDMSDFGIWQNEFIDRLAKNADFNSDGKVSLLDFEIWRKNYFLAVPF